MFAITVVAIIVVATTFNFAEMREAVVSADPWWILTAFGFSLVTTLGAALTLISFSPGRLPFGKTILAQFAGSFVALATPAGIGPAALNLRFLNQKDIATSTGVAVVALSQVSQVFVTILLLIIFAFATGANDFIYLPSTAVLITILATVTVIGALLLVPRIRAWVWLKAGPAVGQLWPRFLAMLSHPLRLLAGLGGNALMSIGFVLAFYSSLQAFGRQLSFTDVAVIFFVGNTVGALLPTPGGLVGVEGALIAGLSAAGLPVAIGTSVTLLFRLVTYWLRIPIGWVALKYLESKNDL